jgi:hypothetical protein
MNARRIGRERAATHIEGAACGFGNAFSDFGASIFTRRIAKMIRLTTLLAAPRIVVTIRLAMLLAVEAHALALIQGGEQRLVRRKDIQLGVDI